MRLQKLNSHRLPASVDYKLQLRLICRALRRTEAPIAVANFHVRKRRRLHV